MPMPRTLLAWTLAAGALSAATSSCGSSDDRAARSEAAHADARQVDDRADEQPDDAPRVAKKERGPPRAIDAATTGTIRGRVAFDGPDPPRKPLPIGSTAGCEHHGDTPTYEDALVKDGRVQNAFVYVRDGLDGWIVPASEPRDVMLDQKGCVYVPHVLGMRIGDRLAIQNSDPATHNVNIRAQRNDGMNPLQPSGAAAISWKPEKREVMVPLECNLHPWMKSYVAVLDHPYFAVTSADGTYSIAGLPPGEYVIEAWHEKWGKKTGKVTLAAGGSADLTLTFKPK